MGGLHPASYQRPVCSQSALTLSGMIEMLHSAHYQRPVCSLLFPDATYRQQPVALRVLSKTCLQHSARWIYVISTVSCTPRLIKDLSAACRYSQRSLGAITLHSASYQRPVCSRLFSDERNLPQIILTMRPPSDEYFTQPKPRKVLRIRRSNFHWPKPLVLRCGASTTIQVTDLATSRLFRSPGN